MNHKDIMLAMPSRIWKDQEAMADYLVRAKEKILAGETAFIHIENQLKSIIRQASSMEARKELAGAYLLLAMIHMKTGNLDMAIDAIRMSENLISKYNLDEATLADLYDTYILYYRDYRGDYEGAARMCRKGMGLGTESAGIEARMHFKGIFGSILINNKEYALAESYINEAMTYYEDTGADGPYRQCLWDMYRIYREMGLEEAAYTQCKKVFVKSYEGEDIRLLEKGALGLSGYHRRKGNHLKAKEILAKVCFDDRDAKVGCSSKALMFELVQVFIELKDYLMAEVWIKEYESHMFENRDGAFDADYFRLKGEIAAGFEDYKEAYAMGKKQQEQLCVTSNSKRMEAEDNIKASIRERSLSRLETINDVGRRLTMTDSGRDILEYLQKTLSEFMSADVVVLGQIFDGIMDYTAYKKDMDEYVSFKTPIDGKDTLANWCVRQKSPLMVNDISAEEGLYVSKVRKKTAVTSGTMVHSSIHIPIMLQGEVVGVFSVQSHHRMAYVMEDLETAKAIGNYLAIKVMNDQTIQKCSGYFGD